MHRRTMGLAAIALWVITVTVLGTLFVSGRTQPGADGRTAVLLAPAERDYMLKEMRGLMAGVHGVIAGLAAGDMARVEKSARAAGKAAAHGAPLDLLLKLPLEFKQAGMAAHHAMDHIADAAAHGEPPAQIMQRLEGLTGMCVACHEVWRVEGE